MDLDQLRYLAAVVRVGTYAEAADQLSVSQPALWKRVNNLERELGLRLFERDGRRVRPTAVGRRLAEQAESVSSAVERIRAEAAAISRGARGLVRLVCAPPHLELLAPGIAAFLLARPDVELQVIESGEIDPTSLLGTDMADVVTGSADPEAPGGFSLYETSVVAVLPPHLDDRARRRLPVDRLNQVPLLTAPAGYYSRRELESACARRGFEPNILIESSNGAALAALAERGVGTAVIADDALPPSDRGHHPVVVADDGPLRREVWCYWRDSYPPADALAASLRSAADSNSGRGDRGPRGRT